MWSRTATLHSSPPWFISWSYLAHESDYNDAQQQYDLFIGLWLLYRLWPKSISLPVDLKERKLWELHHTGTVCSLLKEVRLEGNLRRLGLLRTLNPLTTSSLVRTAVFAGVGGHFHSLVRAKMKSGEKKSYCLPLLEWGKKINPLYHRTLWVRNWIMYC